MFEILIPKLVVLTTQVGNEILRYYKTDMQVEGKSDGTPLTIADQTAHHMIVEALQKLTPGTPILSEESTEIPFLERSKWDEYWLIDPLDGTRDFLEHTGEFCICIAYIKNNRCVFGMVYSPTENTHYYGAEGFPAYKMTNGMGQEIHVKQPSDTLKIVIGHHSSNNEKLQKHLQSLGQHSITKIGSALKFCLIAEGAYDYYPRFGPCSEWDTAAGACILESAGGQVIDKQGRTLKYNTKEDLTSPVFFASGDI